MRRHQTGPLAALAILLGLGACTTASVEERTAACQATDWATYGENDGILGVAPDARADRFADCAELGFPVDQAAYQAGRRRGLERYCTLENGYEVGIDGRRYHHACPPDLEPAFLQGYEQGRKDRPVTIQPSFGFGIGFGHFYGTRHYGFPYYGHYRDHRPRRSGDAAK